MAGDFLSNATTTARNSGTMLFHFTWPGNFDYPMEKIRGYLLGFCDLTVKGGKEEREDGGWRKGGRSYPFPPFLPFLLSSFPPFLLSSLPPFLPSSFPPFLPSSLPPFLPSSLPPFLPSSLPPFLLSSLPPFLPSSLPPLIPSSLPPFLP